MERAPIIKVDQMMEQCHPNPFYPPPKRSKTNDKNIVPIKNYKDDFKKKSKPPKLYNLDSSVEVKSKIKNILLNQKTRSRASELTKKPPVQTRAVTHVGGGRIREPKMPKKRVDVYKQLNDCFSSFDKSEKTKGRMRAGKIKKAPCFKDRYDPLDYQFHSSEEQRDARLGMVSMSYEGPPAYQFKRHRSPMQMRNPMNNAIIQSLRPEMLNSAQSRQWTQAPTISVGQNLMIEARSG